MNRRHLCLISTFPHELKELYGESSFVKFQFAVQQFGKAQQTISLFLESLSKQKLFVSFKIHAKYF